MRSVLDDAAVVEHGDAVGIADGGDAVRDEDGRAPLHHFAQMVENAFFGVGVHAGERVVQDHDARVANESARDGGALLLSARKGDAALADQGRVLVGEGLNVLGDAGAIGRGAHLFVGGTRRAKRDVLADGVGEQEGLLRDESEVAAQLVHRQLADGLAVDQHHAGSGVVDAGNQADQRGLARAGRSDDGQAAAGGNLQIDVAQHRRGAVAEVQAAEFDVARDLDVRVPRWVPRSGPILARPGVFLHISLSERVRRNIGLGFENFLDAHHGSGAALEDVDDPTERDDGPGKLVHVRGEGDELTDVDAPEQYLAAAHPQDQDHRESEHQFQRRPQHSHQADQLQAAPDIFQVGFLEVADLRFFLRERPHDARAGKVFLGARGNIGEAGLDALEALVNAAPEILDDNRHHGQRRKRVQRQARAGVVHEDQRADGEDDGIGRVHDRRAQQVADGVQVIGRARHDVAHAHALIVRIRKLFEVAEEVVAQVEFDVARDANHHPARQELENALGENHDDEQQRPYQELMAQGVGAKVVVVPAPQIVGGTLDDLRVKDPDAVIEQHRNRAEEQPAAVLLQVRKQRSQALEHAK